MVASAVNRSTGKRGRLTDRGAPLRRVRKNARVLRQSSGEQPPGGALPRPGPPEVRPAPAVTVTIAIADGELEQRPGVLAALRDLVNAAGPEAVTFAEPQDGVRREPAPGAGVDGVPVRIDTRTRTVLRDGRAVELSRLEYELLLFLLGRPGRVFSRRELLARVWGHTYTSERTIDVHVSRLRSKLGEDINLINTVYGVGYRLADDPPVEIS